MPEATPVVSSQAEFFFFFFFLGLGRDDFVFICLFVYLVAQGLS